MTGGENSGHGESPTGSGRSSVGASVSNSARVGVFGQIPASIISISAFLALAYVALELSPPRLSSDIYTYFGYSPQRLISSIRTPREIPGAAASLVTYMSLHASFAHLAFNLLWFLVFGTPMARRFASFRRFFVFFALSGAAGALFFTLFHFDDPTLLIGASGGVTGLLGGLVRFSFHRPSPARETAKGVLPIYDRSVLTWSVVIIALNASAAFFGARFGAGDADIAWQAHVGGYLFGLIAFPLFDPRRR